VIRRAGLLLGVLLAGCGAGGEPGGPLTWQGEPYAGTPSKLLPSDHVVLGTIRNDSLKRVKVHYRDVRLLDADGRAVQAAVRFASAPVHSLYPPTREPDMVMAAEDLRIGRAIDLAPGKTAPLVVAWRGDARPVAVDYRAGRLRLPGDQ
jgi:hypothetical protein